MAEIFWAESSENSYKEMSATAHNLLCDVIADKLGIHANEINILKDERGKPYIDGHSDMFISLSHCKGVVMCAFSDKDIGVDVEMCVKRRKSVESRVFTDFEISLLENSDDEDKAFFTLWTLKESYLKAIGTGFSDNAKNIEFLSLKNPIESNNKNYSFTVGERDNFVFAVCEKK